MTNMPFPNQHLQQQMQQQSLQQLNFHQQQQQQQQVQKQLLPTRHKKGRQAGHQEAIGMEKAQGQAETPSIGIQPFLPSRTGADSQEYGKPRL